MAHKRTASGPTFAPSDSLHTRSRSDHSSQHERDQPRVIAQSEEEQKKSLSDLFSNSVQLSSRRPPQMPPSWDKPPVGKPRHIYQQRGGHSRDISDDASSGRYTLSPVQQQPFHNRSSSAPTLGNAEQQQQVLVEQEQSMDYSTMPTSYNADMLNAGHAAYSADSRFDIQADATTGREFVIDHVTRNTFWLTDWPPNVPRISQQQLAIIRQRQQQHYEAQQPISRHRSDGSLQHAMQHQQPTSVLAQIEECRRQPLPPNWEMRVNEKGETYFCDHSNRQTTWNDPRIPTYLLEQAQQYSTPIDQLQSEQQYMRHVQQSLVRQDLIRPTDLEQPMDMSRHDSGYAVADIMNAPPTDIDSYLQPSNSMYRMQ